MSPDAIPEPELLPPLPLAQLAPRRAIAGAAAAGVVLLAMAGVWGAGFNPLAVPMAHAAETHRAATAQVLALSAPAEIAAGQPTVLSVPAGQDDATPVAAMEAAR